MKFVSRVSLTLFILLSWLSFQNCQRGLSPISQPAHLWSQSLWPLLTGGGDPYEGKIYVSQESTCEGSDPYRTRVSLVNHESGFLLRQNCSQVLPPIPIYVGDFTIVNDNEIFFATETLISETSRTQGPLPSQTPTPQPSPTPAQGLPAVLTATPPPIPEFVCEMTSPYESRCGSQSPSVRLQSLEVEAARVFASTQGRSSANGNDIAFSYCQPDIFSNPGWVAGHPTNPIHWSCTHNDLRTKDSNMRCTPRPFSTTEDHTYYCAANAGVDSELVAASMRVSPFIGSYFTNNCNVSQFQIVPIPLVACNYTYVGISGN